MKSMSIVGQNEKGETKFERPLVVGRRDIIILQFPEGLSEEDMDHAIDLFADTVNGDPEDDRVRVIGMSDKVRMRVLRIDN